MAKAPLDYQSPYDRPMKKRKVREPRRFVASPLRMVYWVVMLTLIFIVLMYLRKQTVVRWNELMSPQHSNHPQ